MKYLLPAIVLLSLFLSSCANVPATVEKNAPMEAGSEQSAQENASTETSSGTSIAVVGGDEESLREFIRQWIVPVYPNGISQEVTVYIGSAPKDIPYDLPTPEDSRLIGSITGNWVDYMLVYDTSLTPAAAHEFYAQALVDKGWKEMSANQGGGFTSRSDLFNSPYAAS